jgi:superfamily II DNA or RNA helicase
MDKIKVTYLDGRRCVIDKNNPYFYTIRNHFSYDNPAARFTKYASLPKRLYSISTKGYCDIGLLWGVREFIEREQWDVKLELSDRVKSIMVNPINVDLVEVPNKKLKIYDYQKKSVENAFKMGGGICLVATGGGKSLIISTMVETLYHKLSKNIKILIVVPRLGLITQMYNDFKKHQCSFTYSKWSGKDKLDENANVVIVNTGFLQSSKERSKEYEQFFKKVDCLFYDEVHSFGNDPEPKATKLLKEYNYKHVFGFTGTLEDRTYKSDKVYGYFGRPFYIKTSKELREGEYISNIDVKMINIEHDVDMSTIYTSESKDNPEIENYNLEIEYITYSEYRNNIIKKIVCKLRGNVLLLVDRIEQGEKLQEVFKNEKNKRVYFIRGSMSVDERTKITDEMEKSDDIICIAMSQIFSTGISINNLPYGIFYYIGKAWNKTIQSIGRGLRLHDQKDKFILFDICDNLIFSSKHAEKRKGIYDDQKIEYKEIFISEKTK